MKRDLQGIDLRDAFAPMPEDCRAALAQAVSSCKEDEKVKKFSVRTVLIAAAIVLLTTAMALAATEMLGWTEFLKDTGTLVPEQAIQAMREPENIVTELGPMTFTIRERLADPYYVWSTADIAPTDGSKVLLCADPFDRIRANGENGRALINALGVHEDATWQEAAQALSVPLYSVRAIIEVDEGFDGGEGMEDPLYTENSLSYFSMHTLNAGTANETLPVNWFLRVAQFDPVTGEELACWFSRDVKAELPVLTAQTEKTYQLPEDCSFQGLRIQEVTAQQFATGVYVQVEFLAGEELTEDDCYDALFALELADANGNPLPRGMSLSGPACSSNDVALYHLTYMFGLDTIPDQLMIGSYLLQ